MNESTAQANGQAPVDHFAEAFAETIAETIPPRRRWTLAQWHTFIVYLSSFSSVFLMGYVVGHVL
jgi:hypothetical protein